jgi:hypothetical protein
LSVQAGAFHRFIRDQKATATVEFVAIMPFFMLIAFFILEISVAMFRIASLEKAVQLGARIAVVSDPVVAGVPALNGLGGSGVYGDQCSTGACTGFTTATCTGGSGCNATFTMIATRMRNLFNVPDAKISISYAYINLGFAGGPVIPAVTVTASNVPYDTVFTAILQKFFTTSGAGTSPFVNLPTMSVTLTGEDLKTAGTS